MKHSMKKTLTNAGASIMKQGRQLLERSPQVPRKETAVERKLREAREKLDKEEIKFHAAALPHTRKVKAAIAEAEAHLRKAWLTHQKATKKK